MGEKQRGRGAVPTEDQVRIAKLTLDGSQSEDAQLQKLIKKVIETTRCTLAQAEVALLDNENDVERAVLYILDRDGEVECWTEQKSRKTKKDDVTEKEESPRKSMEGRRGERGSRGISIVKIAERRPPPPSSSRGGGIISGRGGGRGGGIGRGGCGSGRGGAGRGGTMGNTNPARYTVAPASDSNEDWKAGPLVFEQSPATSMPSMDEPTASAAGPISFAAMAKKATAPPPPPQVQPTTTYVPAPEPVVENAPDDVAEEEEEEEQVEDVSPREPTPIPPPSPEPVPEEIEKPVEIEWANNLKAELGIGRVEETNVNAVASRPAQRVEFVQATGVAPLSEYHFGFSAPEPEPLMAAPPPAPVSLPEVQHTYIRAVPTSSIPPPSQPSPPPVESRVSDVPTGSMKSSPPTSLAHQSSRGTLSYDATSSVGYAGMDTRGMMGGHRVQQPQPQQQAPPSNMFPPQMQYTNYPYMGMYSPVGGNMRADADPYAAALMQYPFGMGQIDLTSILSSQSAAPPRTEHSDMAKYGQRGNESVAPPPGFPTNTFVAAAQPSLSNLLMQPQYTHPFSFMMPSVSGGRYEDDRRGVQMGKDQQVRGTHHAQNTPPPHAHYSHHQPAPPTGAYLGGANTGHKKNQYGSGQWNS